MAERAACLRSWHANGTQKRGGQAVQDKKQKVDGYKIGMYRVGRDRAWRNGTGPATFHETHPLAERKPRREFLEAFEFLAPEIHEPLQLLRPLWASVYKQLRILPNTINELEDWREVSHAVSAYPFKDQTKDDLIAMHSALKAWASNYFLSEPYWTTPNDWVLDIAVDFLSTRSIHFVFPSDGQKEYLTQRQRTLVLEECVPLYRLQDGGRWKKEYIKNKKAEWEAKLIAHMKAVEAMLDSKYGKPDLKESRIHFFWLALRHVFGYSSGTICEAYKAIENEAFKKGIDLGKDFVPNVRSIDEAISKTAAMIGLAVRPSLQGNRADGLVNKERDDVIKRLQLHIFLQG